MSFAYIFFNCFVENVFVDALYCNNNGKSLEWTKVYLIALNIQTCTNTKDWKMHLMKRIKKGQERFLLITTG